MVVKATELLQSMNRHCKTVKNVFYVWSSYNEERAKSKKKFSVSPIIYMDIIRALENYPQTTSFNDPKFISHGENGFVASSKRFDSAVSANQNGSSGYVHIVTTI